MPLSLSKRSATVANSITVNTQKHGEESVSAIYMNLSQFAILPEELPEVLLEKRAYALLYRKWKSRPDEPIWGKIAPVMRFTEKVKGVRVTLYLGRRQLKIDDATLTSIKLEPKSGGTSHLAFQLQFVPQLDENHPAMEALLSRVNQEIDLELECETYGAQPDLPLEEEADPDAQDEDEDEDGEEEELPSAAHARRKRKA